MNGRSWMCLCVMAWACLGAAGTVLGQQAPAPVSGPEVRPVAPPVPAWALGTVRLKGLGTSFARLARYCDSVASNTGAILRQGLEAKLFPIPVGEGIAQDQPAYLFFLDAPSGGGLGELAMLLPVANAKALKESIAATLGGQEKDGLLRISIPQGFDKPEKNLLLRVGDQSALLAPDEATLKKLGELAAGKELAAMARANDFDVAMAVNLEALRRAGQKDLERLREVVEAVGAAFVPELGGEIQAFNQNVLGKARELELLEVHALFEPDRLGLVARVNALPDTALARQWSLPAAKGAGGLEPLLPSEAILALRAFPRQPSTDLASPADPGLAPVEIGPAAPATQATLAALRRDLAKLAASSGGGAALVVSAAPDGGLQLLLALGAARPTETEAALKASLLSAAAAAVESCRAELNLPPEAPVPFALEALPEVPCAGVQARGFQVCEPAGAKVKLLPEVRRALERLAGWPFTLRYAAVQQGMLVAAGKESLGVLQAALEKAARPAGERPAAAPAPGLSLSLRPAGLACALLHAALEPEKMNEVQLTGKLSDAAVLVRVGSASGSGVFRLVLPAQAMHALGDLYLRLLRAGLDPFQIRIPGTKSASPEVPAPAPAP